MKTEKKNEQSTKKPWDNVIWPIICINWSLQRRGLKGGDGKNIWRIFGLKISKLN